MSTARDIVGDLEDYVAACGGKWEQWYVGIAADAQDRLFSDHNVSRKDDAWIYRTASTSTIARAVERYLLDTHGGKGGPGGGDDDTCMIYAYRITAYTVE